MSMAPRQRWSGRPSRTSRASRIIPAQVPKAGSPAARRSRERLGQARRVEQLRHGGGLAAGHDEGVDVGELVGRADLDRRRRRSAREGASACGDRSAPWRASDGRPSVDGGRSPAAVGEGGLERADLEAGHGRAEAAADLGQDGRVAEVGGGLDDGLGPQRRGRRT